MSVLPEGNINVPHACLVPKEARKGVGEKRTSGCLWATMWVVGTKPRSSVQEQVLLTAPILMLLLLSVWGEDVGECRCQGRGGLQASSTGLRWDWGDRHTAVWSLWTWMLETDLWNVQAAAGTLMTTGSSLQPLVWDNYEDFFQIFFSPMFVKWYIEKLLVKLLGSTYRIYHP